MQEIIGRGLAFPFTIGVQGSVQLTSERSEIEQAIHIILSTEIGSRVMRPTFGCQIHDLVFAAINDETISQVKRYVKEALAMWEPRITGINVIVTRDLGPNQRGMPTFRYETDLIEVSDHDVDYHSGTDYDARLNIQIDYTIKNTTDERSLVYPFYLIPEE